MMFSWVKIKEDRVEERWESHNGQEWGTVSEDGKSGEEEEDL